MQSEVLLKVKYRPLRFVYLVDSEADLIKATTLYTHLWGGACSAIFPVPKDDGQTLELRRALCSFNPDYIFLPEGNIECCDRLLNTLPSCCLSLSTEQIESIANLAGYAKYFPVTTLNSFKNLEVPHIIRILETAYLNPSNSGGFCVATNESLFNVARILQFGNPSNCYREHLMHRLDGSALHLGSLEDFLKMSLLESIGVFRSSISLTRRKITNWSSSLLEGFREENIKVCNLFLHESEDVSVAASFWNSRSADFDYSNKFLLPKEAFLENLENIISILSSFLPFVTELIIYVNLERKYAETLASDIYSIFERLKTEVFVEVRYQGHGFLSYPSRAYSSDTVEMTRQILSNQSIRFSPTPPPEFRSSKCVFGYDATVEFTSGSLLEIPLDYDSSVLLSNKSESIECWENRSSYTIQHKLQPVRGDRKGISGVAVDGQECKIQIPNSEQIITRWLREGGLSFQPTQHTRYAQGFIKRFGGFPETRRLVNSGGTKIFVALECERSEESGFKQSQIVGFLKHRFSLSKSDAKKIVESNLLQLLAKDLVYRGYSLRCPICELNAWYKLDRVSEFVECIGCAESFQLDKLTSIEFSYKSNELAARFVRSGGIAILSAVIFLSRIVPYRNIQMGGEILIMGEKQPIAEIDLFAFSKDYLTLVECKSYTRIDAPEMQKIVEHLKRVIETATRVEARVVILCIVTTNFDSAFMIPIHDVAEEAAQRNIGVHLLLNDELYLFGVEDWKTSERDSYSLRVESLLPSIRDEEQSLSIKIGKKAEVYNFGRTEIPNQKLIALWQQELQPPSSASTALSQLSPP